MNETMNKVESFQEIIKGDKPVLVDFFAEWCGPCKLMKPILHDLHEKMGDDVRILKVDVDKSPKASAYYNISGVPTLMLFKNGEIVWRQAGIVPAASLQKIINQFI